MDNVKKIKIHVPNVKIKVGCDEFKIDTCTRVTKEELLEGTTFIVEYVDVYGGKGKCITKPDIYKSATVEIEQLLTDLNDKSEVISIDTYDNMTLYKRFTSKATEGADGCYSKIVLTNIDEKNLHLLRDILKDETEKETIRAIRDTRDTRSAGHISTYGIEQELLKVGNSIKFCTIFLCIFFMLFTFIILNK